LRSLLTPLFSFGTNLSLSLPQGWILYGFGGTFNILFDQENLSEVGNHKRVHHITLIKERSRKDSTIMREKNRVLDLPTE